MFVFGRSPGLQLIEGVGQGFIRRSTFGTTSRDGGSLCLKADQKGALPKQESDEGTLAERGTAFVPVFCACN